MREAIGKVRKGRRGGFHEEKGEEMDNFIVSMLVPALIFWGITLISMKKDRSRYRNCYFLMASIVFTVPVICSLGGELSRYIFLILLGLLFLVLLSVPALLVANGIIMLRKEGHSLGNLLSLLLGIFVGIGEIATFAAVFSYDINRGPEKAVLDASILFLIVSLTVIYISLTIVAFVVYSLFLQIIPRKRDFDYVIIHGAGLLRGDKVSRLLADRLDKAIEIYRKDPTPPVLIPSGGKGGDETISEEEAMTGYLLEHGIPREHILPEDKSATTYENLVNSKRLIDGQEGRKYTALVTSNYHVYRALRYCRKIGLKCTGIGAHVAFYYWPSALFREYIAIHKEKKHALWLAAGWALTMLPVVLLIWR